MATSLTTLYPLLNIPRCPEPRVLQALRNASRRFFRDTEIWRVRLPVADSVDGQKAYKFDTGYSDTLFIRLPVVKIGGVQYDEGRYSVSEGVSYYDFDGVGDSLELDNPVQLNSDDELEFQLRLESVPFSSSEYVLTDGTVAPNNYIGISAQGGLRMNFGSAATFPDLSINQNYHIRLVRSGENTAAWVNGESQGALETGSDSFTLYHLGYLLDGQVYAVYKNGILLDTFSGTTSGNPVEIHGQALLEFGYPLTSNGDTIEVTGVLTPKVVCNEIDTNLIQRWGDTIAHGAEAEIKMDKGSEQDPHTWYDPQGASVAERDYITGVGRARMEVATKRESGRLHVVRHKDGETA